MQDEAFGLTGLGCTVESVAGEVTPNDGVRKRLRFVTEKVDLNASSGEFEEVTLRGAGAGLQVQMWREIMKFGTPDAPSVFR